MWILMREVHARSPSAPHSMSVCLEGAQCVWIKDLWSQPSVKHSIIQTAGNYLHPQLVRWGDMCFPSIIASAEETCFPPLSLLQRKTPCSGHHKRKVILHSITLKVEVVWIEALTAYGWTTVSTIDSLQLLQGGTHVRRKYRFQHLLNKRLPQFLHKVKVALSLHNRCYKKVMLMMKNAWMLLVFTNIDLSYIYGSELKWIRNIPLYDFCNI